MICFKVTRDFKVMKKQKRKRAKLSKVQDSRSYKIIYMNYLYPPYWDDGKYDNWNRREFRTWKRTRRTQWK